MKILITGTAGFIGFHLTRRLLEENHQIVGLDNINDYYDVGLKKDRLKETGIVEIKENELVKSSIDDNYRFIKTDLQNREVVEQLFESERFDAVINLAAQAGVRYSLENPHTYVESNIVGFLNILEGCRHTDVSHLMYASSSSVYGSNKEMPFKTTDNVDHPVSLYAASKKSDELMAHTYSHLYDIPTTGLRFFTVYGPWGRPDMALFLFTKAMIEGRTIDVFNHGDMARDFTYVDDIVEGMKRLLHKAPSKSSEKSTAPYQLFNIGYGSPVNLMDFIHEIEKNLEIEAEKNFMDIQPGDVPKTWADVEPLNNLTGFRPQVSVREGVKKFINWYKKYYTHS
ncbi:NAD-dependent epimerase [Rhodohalobacter sulfatireducens]|uniref:NAD-dependent epimerase n=1 Tax=Rhodohalobacter sulfatireducens TaxID=2911366 RepID=A0ABS9KHU4_9BACT|nr:NAD-dependent epimerase [Rhodohalobacter sulfatireducens]MCG2590423.1 NAD-dependent epimerase [Rhodohalobacter sulfatireducens]